jgi:predicted nucleotidyltransferase
MDSRSTILQELKASLKSFLGDQLVRLVLFGSVARGDYHDASDIDVYTTPPNEKDQKDWDKPNQLSKPETRQTQQTQRAQ